jgi:hypothetical protein
VVWFAVVLGLGAHAARAEVVGVKKARGSHEYVSSDYVPLYPGDNELRLRGPGVHRALAVHFPPGIADRADIQSRHGGSDGTQAIDVRVRIKRGVTGKVLVKLTYSDTDAQDVWRARVFRRGVVRSISAPARAKVGETLRLGFVGEGFGVAAMRDGGPFFNVERVSGSDTSAQFDVTFLKCGTLQLGAGLLHDSEVPLPEVLSGEAAYEGEVGTTITVRAASGAACSSVSTPTPQFNGCRSETDDAERAQKLTTQTRSPRRSQGLYCTALSNRSGVSFRTNNSPLPCPPCLRGAPICSDVDRVSLGTTPNSIEAPHWSLVEMVIREQFIRGANEGIASRSIDCFLGGWTGGRGCIAVLFAN